MGIIPINFQSLNPDSAQGINTQSVNATLPIASLPQGNLSAMGFNVVGNGVSQVVAADFAIVANPTATDILTGNLLENALGENISIVSINIQSQSYAIGSLINLQGIGNLTINVNGDYNLLVNNINFSGALPNIDFVVANNNQSDGAIFKVVINRLGTGGAFQANDDYVAISQGTDISGNLLDNDNGDNLFIESFTISSLPGVTFLSGETCQIQIYQQSNYLNVASIKIMVDGNYYLTALNSFFNGNLPLITYVLRNNLGAIDTAKLNIAINTNINPPALPPSNSVNIPSVTPVPLPIPVVVPPILEPLPILQPLTLTLNEDSSVSGNLLENGLFPNIQLIEFSFNGNTHIASSDEIIINEIGNIKFLANGSYTFTPFYNYNSSVPLIEYSLSNGFDVVTNTIQFIINPIFDYNDDLLYSNVIYWGNGRSNFTNVIAAINAIPLLNNNPTPLVPPSLNGTNYLLRSNGVINHEKYADCTTNTAKIGLQFNIGNQNTNLTIEGYFNIRDIYFSPLVTGERWIFDLLLATYGGDSLQVLNTFSITSTVPPQQIWIDKQGLNLYNQWKHIAIVLGGWQTSSLSWQSLKLFVDGVLQDEYIGTISRSYLGNYLYFFVGLTPCWISHLRITKAERYTQNFNPLTESYLF
jgi:hypothetical protein